MSQVSKNLLGLTLDDGAGYFIKESAQSESGVASITNVLLETCKFIGSQTRNEYLMPQMTQMNWALRKFENNIPDCMLLFEEAMASPSPMDAIAKFDELLRLAVGSAAAPCLRVIPGTSVLQSSYGAAQSIQDSLHGQYRFDGYIQQPGNTPVYPAPLTPITMQAMAANMAANWLPVFSALDLENLGRLINLIRVWRGANLGNIGDQLGPDDARGMLHAMSIYQAMPVWAAADVAVADTGEILINGVPTVDLPVIEQAFPAIGDPIGNLPYGGGVRPIAQWVQQHNDRVQRRPTYAMVTRVQGTYIPQAPNDRYVQRDWNTGREILTTRQDLVNALGAGNIVFTLDFENVREYMVFPPHVPGGPTVNQRRSQATNVWIQSHGGVVPSGSAQRTATNILAIRQGMIRSAALVPGVAARLADLRDDVAYLQVPPVVALVNALNGVEYATNSAQLQAFIDAAQPALEQIMARMPSVSILGDGRPTAALNTAGYTVIGAGRFAPTPNSAVALVPVLGRGVRPVRYVMTGGALAAQDVLDVAVVLEEPPSTVYSPVKTMLGTALLARLVNYLNGFNLPPGYNFDPYDPNNPYGVGQARPCPRSLLVRQMDRYEQALVQQIENATVDSMPDILRCVQKLVDARYFLLNLDEVLNAIMEREDWIYMLQSLIVGLLVQDGAQITDTTSQPIVSVDAGVVPRQAAEFLFGTVLRDIRVMPGYDAAVAAALQLGINASPVITQAANLARVIRAEVLFGRARNGLELLKSLLDGSNDLVRNVHVGTIQHLIDVDLANQIMAALCVVFDRDYLGLIDKVEFEAPWECAEWTTQFAAFSFFVDSCPILYQAVDVAREVAVDSGMAAVASALSRVGFDWTEIAPADLRVRGVDQSAYALTPPMPMAGLGVQGPAFYNDAPVSHQSLKVTTVMPSYDVEAYNLVKAYLTMNTSRTYFAQVVGRDIADLYTIRLPIGYQDPVLDLVLNEGPGGNRRQLLNGAGIQMEKTPALANVAMILPYVSNYLQKTALTRDVAVPQIMEIDSARSLAGTSGVMITSDLDNPAILTPTNGLAINVAEKRSISTALPWIGS